MLNPDADERSHIESIHRPAHYASRYTIRLDKLLRGQVTGPALIGICRQKMLLARPATWIGALVRLQRNRIPVSYHREARHLHPPPKIH